MRREKTRRFKIYKKTFMYNFEQYERIRPFGDNIYTGKININE